MSEADDRPVAFRWLELVLSKQGPSSPVVKLVLVAVFQRIDWDTGEGFFESARSLSDRLGIGKSTAASCLAMACSVGPFLKRTERAAGKEPWRRGFTYSLAFPVDSLSPCTDRDRKDCPATGTEEKPLSKMTGGSVRNGADLCPATGTYSPSESPMNPSERANTLALEARVPRPSLRTEPPRDDTSAWQRARELAVSIGFREPEQGETIGHYSGAVTVARVEAMAAAQGGAT